MKDIKEINIYLSVCRMNEAEFMEFSDIENHEDFYSYEEGRIHVQDQRGYYVMYSAALDDLATLEQDLLLISTHYIEKDKEMRNAHPSSARKRQVSCGCDGRLSVIS